MKKIYSKVQSFHWLLSALLIVSAASCKKEYNSTGFTPGTGVPTITSVHTLSKTINDTSITQRDTYDASGNLVSVSDTNYAHQSIVPFDSVTSAGEKGHYYVINGSNLGSTSSVTFNGVSAYFNRALITDNALIVSIPMDVPTFGPEATDTLTVTTLHGKVSYKFVVMTPPPTVASVSDYNFWAGSQITFTGVGFGSVTSVGITGTTQTCTIISQTDAQLVLQFPATTVNRATLEFSYVSQGNTVKLVTKNEYNDLDNAYTVFYKGAFQNDWADNSWHAPSGVSTGASHSFGYNASITATYPQGSWQIEGWANWYPSLDYDASYKYLTFYVKGGTTDQTLALVGDQLPGGYSQNTAPPAVQQIFVPAKVWTYFKIPLGTGAGQLNFWASGTPAKQLGFFLKGPDDEDQQLYFDEVAFLK